MHKLAMNMDLLAYECILKLLQYSHNQDSLSRYSHTLSMKNSRNIQCIQNFHQYRHISPKYGLKLSLYRSQYLVLSHNRPFVPSHSQQFVPSHNQQLVLNHSLRGSRSQSDNLSISSSQGLK